MARTALIALGIGCVAATSALVAPARATTDGEANRLVSRAIAAVDQRTPRCEPRTNANRATVVQGTVPAALRRELGILRRPQTSEEAALLRVGRTVTGRSPLLPADMDRIFARATRIGVTASGRRIAVIVGRMDVREGTPAAGVAVCAPRFRAALRTREGAVSAATRRAADRMLTEYVAGLRVQPPHALVSIGTVDDAQIDQRSDGDRAETIRDFGRIEDVSGFDEPVHTPMIGIVPDGVASVTAQYGRRSVDIPVRDNLLDFTSPFGGNCGNQEPPATIWHAADGSVIARRATVRREQREQLRDYRRQCE